MEGHMQRAPVTCHLNKGWLLPCGRSGLAQTKLDSVDVIVRDPLMLSRTPLTNQRSPWRLHVDMAPV